MLALTKGVFDAWFLADMENVPRASRAQEVAAVLRDLGQSNISHSRNLRQALARARQFAAEGDTLVVFGSFYTVAELLPKLEKHRVENEAV